MELIKEIFEFVWQILSYEMVGVDRAIVPAASAFMTFMMSPAGAALISSLGAGLGGLFTANANNKSLAAQQGQFNQQRQDRLTSLDERNKRADFMGGQMPDLESIYAQYGITPESLNQAYSGDALKEAYAVGGRNLDLAEARGVSQASNQAGASAASRGLINPSSFISAQTNPIREQYAGQRGGLQFELAKQMAGLSKEKFGAMQGLAGMLAQLKQQGFQNRMGLEQFRGQDGYSKTYR